MDINQQLFIDRTKGSFLHQLASELYPICRSLTGDGVRQTLSILQQNIPTMEIHEVPSGTRCFDWEVPPEWNVRKAFLLDPEGKTVLDFKDNNLHVVGYSVPVDLEIELNELQEHLYSLPEQPSAIPYVTSYYAPRWGFCLTEEVREKLKPGRYRAVIDSTLNPQGHLTYGELIIPGKIEKEVFISTYICHPSMANNELSGPMIALALAQWCLGQNLKHTFRFIFIPETIGSICYLSRNINSLKQRIIAGFNLSCVGDERNWSYLPSRLGNTLADKVALHTLNHTTNEFIRYSFLDRGSDERQYCSPGVDLPVCSILRTKFGKFPEYHTSLDDLNLVTAKGLQDSYECYVKCLYVLEKNCKFQAAFPCEPQMGRRSLYPTLGLTGRAASSRDLMNLLAWADGSHDLIDVANIMGKPVWNLVSTLEVLAEHNLIRIVNDS